jgi:tetratricopeptide (TPR) repeat protein
MHTDNHLQILEWCARLDNQQVKTNFRQGDNTMNIPALLRLTRTLPLILLLNTWVTNARTDVQINDLSPPIGQVDFPVSCSAEIQDRFERAVMMLHHMMYAQAEKEFRSIASRDPECAMAHWGIAMTLFHPLWPGEPTEEELRQGSISVQNSKALKPPTDREKAYILAAESYYADWKNKTHPDRIASWRESQESVYKSNPDDTDAAAFYALSLLSIAPKADKTYAYQKKAGVILEDLYSREPEHPGVVHYLIHAYDNSELAGRALGPARAYDKIAPNVPHALHMPTHIFTRLGFWADSIDWNIRSADAALNYPVSGAISHHYLHALDYLIYAYLQGGEDDKAEEVLNQMNERNNYQKTFVTGYALAALPARYTLERKRWGDAAELEIPERDSFPWEEFPEVEAIIHYARGLGAARIGEVEKAREALEALDGIHENLVKAGQQYWGILVEAQRKTVAAWLEYSEGRKSAAIQLMEDAARLEESVDKNPVTPGSVLPARELLGEMLLLSGSPDKALNAYEISLDAAPKRFNSLYGAGQATEDLGRKEMAKSYYEELLQISSRSSSERPEVRHARLYVADYGE